MLTLLFLTYFSLCWAIVWKIIHVQHWELLWLYLCIIRERERVGFFFLTVGHSMNSYDLVLHAVMVNYCFYWNSITIWKINRLCFISNNPSVSVNPLELRTLNIIKMYNVAFLTSRFCIWWTSWNSLIIKVYIISLCVHVWYKCKASSNSEYCV